MSFKDCISKSFNCKADFDRQLAEKQTAVNTLKKQLSDMTAKYSALEIKYSKFEGKEVIVVPPKHSHTEGIAATRAECEKAIRDRLAGKKLTWALSSATDAEYRLYPLELLQKAITELPGSIATWTPTNTGTGWHLEYADCDDDAIHWRYWLQRQYPGCPTMIVFIPGHFFAAALAQGGKILQINGSFEDVQSMNIWF